MGETDLRNEEELTLQESSLSLWVSLRQQQLLRGLLLLGPSSLNPSSSPTNVGRPLLPTAPAPPLRQRLLRRRTEVLVLIMCGLGACSLLRTASLGNGSVCASISSSFGSCFGVGFRHQSDRNRTSNSNSSISISSKNRSNSSSRSDSSTDASISESIESAMPRIFYTLHRGLGMDFRFTQREYECRIHFRSRKALPDEMRLVSGLFDFFPRIATDLKILFAGDSVAVQLAQALEESVGSQLGNRQVYALYQNGADAAYVSAPIRGGGALAAYRLFHFFHPGNEKTEETLQRRRRLSFTWSRSQVNALLNHSYTPAYNEIDEPPRNETTREKGTTSIGKFDAVVQRISHGWHGLEDVTMDALRVSTNTVHELFGARTVVLLNLPYVNNVWDVEDYRMLVEKRQVVRDFAHSYVPPADGSGVRAVVVLEQGEWLDDLYEWNARILGFNTSNGVEDWLFGHRLAKYKPTSPLSRKIAHHCSERVPDNSTGCLRNALTEDGMHPCLSTQGGRLLSGIACLLACTHNHQPPLDRDELLQCESDCNSRFMSLEPVPASELLPWNATR